MKIPSALLLVPERIWLFVFIGIFFLGTASSFFVHKEASSVEHKIMAKQREVASVLQLKDTYEAKKQSKGTIDHKAQSVGMSLATIESVVSKVFVGGRLAALKPASSKEEKVIQQMAFELSVTGASLGEIVTFLKTVKTAGFDITKLQLTVPQANPAGLDMRAILVQV